MTSPQHDILELLLAQGDISKTQFEQARNRVTLNNIDDRQALLELGFASPEKIYAALSAVTGIPFISLTDNKPQPEAQQKVSEKIALHYSLVPVKFGHGVLVAAFDHPVPLRDQESLRLILGVGLEPVLATPMDINAQLKKMYGIGADKVLQIRKERKPQKTDGNSEYVLADMEQQELDSTQEQQDASIINLVNEIIADAIRLHATDVHIEPYRTRIRLRYRIDGMLQEIATPPGMEELQEAIISRLKIMAKLNIAEKRLPHDGRIRLLLKGQPSDIRVSLIPTRFGETVCLRILPSSAIFISMAKLGLSPYQLALFQKLAAMPHGMMLVTGPTGSGKTTTLYAALAYLREKFPERKIITVENPVEYEMDGTTQIQMHAEIGLTFATALRAILRHDPDIILVGEIRDNETAEIAIQSALTGHLVLSTLHTNDSVGAVNRLVNMGIEPYLVSSALFSVVAQRLVRHICPHCRTEIQEISPRIRQEIADATGIPPAEVRAWHGTGCQNCEKTGYRGRLALYEIFLVDNEIQDMIAVHAQTGELRNAAVAKGMKTLRQDGWLKVINGETTIEEVQRITSNFQISYNLADLD